jgi:hypothetical protein
VLARIFEDDHDLETLILCPKNLVRMWEDYGISIGCGHELCPQSGPRQMPNPRRYRLIVIDESHNRNREGKRYRYSAIHQGTKASASCLRRHPITRPPRSLESAAPLCPRRQGPRRPAEKAIARAGETEFIRRHQCSVRSLAAFEKSEHADDWRELMRLYLVRRTRSFIQENYAETDPVNGRQYLVLDDGSRSYFPTRKPLTAKFTIDDKDPDDQYARLYGTAVVGTINRLNLPRYGLGNYQAPSPHEPPTQTEARQLQDLSGPVSV